MTGIITTNITGQGNETGYDIAIQSDGKILVAGTAGLDFAVVRYNSDGSLDSSFGVDGKITTDLSSGANDAGIDYGRSLAVQADGKILLAGYHKSDASHYDFAVVRYNANGSLDGSFDGDGKLTTRLGGKSNGNSYDLGYGIAVQSDGKILVAGVSENEYTRKVDGILRYNSDFALLRYNDDGSLDSSFGGGKIITNLGKMSNDIYFSDAAYSVTVQSDGKILVAGDAETEYGHDFAVVRYNTDGSVDGSFVGGSGITTNFGLTGSSFYDVAYSVAVQADGKILVAGTSNRGDSAGDNYYDFALARYNSNGSLDTGFDGDGKVLTNFGYNSGGGYYDIGHSVTTQADGKILVAGFSDNGSKSRFALARYNSDGSLDATFDGDGLVTTELVGQCWGYGVAVQSDGKILVSGSSNSSTAFGVVRYNSDGSLDTTFSGQAPAPDTTAPRLIGLTPNDNAGNVPINSNLALAFDETVKAGGGNIVIYNASGSIAKTIAVTDASQVTFSGSTVIVNPSSDLAAKSGYYLNVAAGAIQDSAGNGYAGISGKTAYNFTTGGSREWSAMSSTDLRSLTTAQWLAMTTSELRNLSAEQWSTMATDDLRSLSTAQWATITTDSLRNLSSAQWSAMAGDDLRALTTAQWSAMATDDLLALTSAQWSALASDDLRALTTQQWATLTNDDLDGLTTAQWSALASDDLQALTTAQWQALAGNDLRALTTAQWSTMAGNDLASLSTAQWTSMATDDLRALTTAQWAALSSDDLIALTTAQWSAMASDDLRALSNAQWSAMSSDDLRSLTTAQWSTLAGDDLNALTTVQWAAMASDDLRALTSSQWSTMTNPALNALSTAQWSAMASDDLRALTTSQWQAMANDDLPALSSAQWSTMASDDLRALTTAQWSAMTSDDLRALTTAQWSAMAGDDLNALSSAQWSSLATDDLRALTSAQWSLLSGDALNSLTSAQWSSMELADLKALTPSQWSSMALDDMMALSSGTITSLLASTSSKALSVGMAAAGFTLANKQYTPLMLDLNGDGVQTVDIAHGVVFDLNADGKAERVGWVSAQDGLLVRDLDHNGQIDDGRELFGSGTTLLDGRKAADGFQALHELDANRDGVVDARDRAFDELQVWIDGNQNGVADSGELHGLTAWGIDRLDATAKPTALVNHGNWIGLESSYHSVDGTHHALVDVWLQATNLEYQTFLQTQSSLMQTQAQLGGLPL